MPLLWLLLFVVGVVVVGDVAGVVAAIVLVAGVVDAADAAVVAGVDVGVVVLIGGVGVCVFIRCLCFRYSNELFQDERLTHRPCRLTLFPVIPSHY